MSGSYLLETTIVVAFLRKDEAIRKRLAEADEIFVSSITVGELFYGVAQSLRSERNRQEVEEFLATCTVLPCDEATGRVYGPLKKAIRQRGRPIPENDLWIAATGIRFGLSVVTRDDHFEVAEGLTRERW